MSCYVTRIGKHENVSRPRELKGSQPKHYPTGNQYRLASRRRTSVRMMIPKMAKKAMTIRNDMLVRSREPHVPFLLRFFVPEDFVFFEDSFEYIFRR